MLESASFQSLLLVFLSEMGDKTQLLALVLAAKFKKPWAILSGITVATLLNHGVAAWAGEWLSTLLNPQILSYVLALTFIAFAVWLLIPDKEEDLKIDSKYGVFLTTTVAFFIAEMGDKTQLATVALGAKFQAPLTVTIGSTLGMLLANGLGVFLGDRLLQKVPLRRVHVMAAVLFVLFSVAILFGY